MRPARPVLVTLLFAALGAAARGGDTAAEAALKEKGLARSGLAFVIEAEAPVLAKMDGARATYTALATLADKQASAEHAVAMIPQLAASRAMAQERLDYMNSELGQLGNISSGLPPGKSFKFGRATTPMKADMVGVRDQARKEVDEIGRLQDANKALIPSEKEAKEIDAEIREKAESLKVQLVALRPMVDEVAKKYADLAADEAVKKALADAKKATRARLKLGPSDAFLAGAKALDKAERDFLGKKAVPAKAKAKAKK